MRWMPCVWLLFLASVASFGGEWIWVKAPKAEWKAVERSGFRPLRTFGPGGNYAVFDKAVSRAEVPPEILWVQPNYQYEAMGTDPELAKSWGLNNEGSEIEGFGVGLPGWDIKAYSAWKLGVGSRNVKIAVLDSGVAPHEDLKTNLMGGWDFVDNDNNPNDPQNHGTFVAGIIGADFGNGKGTRGVMPYVSLIPIRVLDASGFGTTERAVKGIDYARQLRAQVINASWGGLEYDPLLFDAVKRATTAGILFVTAAGNLNRDNDRKNTYPANFDLAGLVSVGSSNALGLKARSSNYGKKSVHLTAPGDSIFSTIPGGYAVKNGTSFSAPHVSGVAGLIIAKYPNCRATCLVDRLMRSTTPTPYYERNRTISGGFLNAYNALAGIFPERLKTPTQWNVLSVTQSTSHPYANDELQTLKVRVPGAKHVRLRLKRFSTEPTYDVVTVKDGLGQEVATYNGQLGDFVTDDALGEEIQVELKSDFKYADYGFDIEAAEWSTQE